MIGVDQVPERLALAERYGVETIDFGAVGDVVAVIRDPNEGRGADSVIDAVGMEADGSSIEGLLQAARLQADRFHAIRRAHDAVRRGGTLSICGVYGRSFSSRSRRQRAMSFRRRRGCSLCHVK